MNGTSYVYIVTRRSGMHVDILDVHRRLEYARKQLEELLDEAKRDHCRTMLTQAGCCLRAQKGDSVHYYEIGKYELK